GGFDLHAAEAVCGAEPIAPEDVLDLVTSLVEKSLVMLEQEGDGSRYGLLETIKEFAHEHLSKRFGLLGTIQEFAQERMKDRDEDADGMPRDSPRPGQPAGDCRNAVYPGNPSSAAR